MNRYVPWFISLGTAAILILEPPDEGCGYMAMLRRDDHCQISDSKAILHRTLSNQEREHKIRRGAAETEQGNVV